MVEELSIQIGDCNLNLGDRYIQKDGDLLLSDVHFGKTMHFRKAGMPLPIEARGADQSSFMELIKSLSPERVIMLGDLFHSEQNSEVDEVAMITSQFPDVEFILVKGNHDVMPESTYRSIDVITCDIMDWNGFILSHEPLTQLGDSALNMHGHIHPGVVLRGKGRQRIKIPCFHFDGQRLCLPAFGALTGLMSVRPKKDHRVFGIIDSSVIELPVEG